MKRLYALLVVAFMAITPSLSAQSASFYNATRDAEKMIKQMPTHNYYRAYVGYNSAHVNWKDYGLVGEMMYPIKSGITLGYLESRHVWKGLPLFVEYGANIQCLYGKEDLREIALIGHSYKANIVSLNIPVNAAFRLSFENDTIAVTPFAGLNFRLNIAGSRTDEYALAGEVYSDTIKLFDSSNDENAAGAGGAFNRFQVGLNLGFAVTYKVYTLSVSRVADISKLANIHNGAFDDKGRLGVTTIALGYAF